MTSWKPTAINNFNPRSREGSDLRLRRHMKSLFDFNPRSREGSDRKRKYSAFSTFISILAPARGATESGRYTLRLPVISILAPARGATQLLSSWDTNGEYFNPRSREGSDTAPFFLGHQRGVFQSSLPRGERLNDLSTRYILYDFNPRSREGSDVAFRVIIYSL